MFALQTCRLEGLALPEIQVEWLDVDTGTSKFDLTFVVQDFGRGAAARVEYNSALFDADTIQRLLEHFENLLRAVASDPAVAFPRCRCWVNQNADNCSKEWNDTATDYPRTHCIHQLFEAQARERPDATGRCFWPRFSDVRPAQRTGQSVGAMPGPPQHPAGRARCLLRRALHSDGRRAAGDSQGRRRIRPARPALPRRTSRVHAGRYANRGWHHPKKSSAAVAPSRRQIHLPGYRCRFDRERKHRGPSQSRHPGARRLHHLHLRLDRQPKGVAVPHRAVNRLVRNQQLHPVGRHGPDRAGVKHFFRRRDV